MKIKDVVVTWDVGGDVQVFQKSLNMPLLGRWAYYTDYNDESLTVLMSDFVAITVRDGCSPLVAHKAFMLIDEYSDCMAIDV
jgi:hypothetical protein